MYDTPVKVWDFPLRLFHWLLVSTVTISYLSVKTDWLNTDLHWYAGISASFLWFFRFIWGFVGTATAQFTQFFPTPRRLLRYFRHGWHEIGHTPTGGLSVIALLLLLGGMIGTGVLSSDDITLQGPLAKYVDESLTDQMSEWHARLFNIFLGLITLHILAIFYYLIFKKNNLLHPMITGVKAVPLSMQTSTPIRKKFWRYLWASLLIAGLLTWGLFSSTAHHFFYQSSPVTTAPASTPAW